MPTLQPDTTNTQRRSMPVVEHEEDNDDCCTMQDCCHCYATGICYTGMIGVAGGLWCLIQAFCC
ncbi:hypothetical protein FJ365_04475 [Candidatus Dependentiae bacterium]|nr:hypothetical protein [Candidatus Dependentiae bacterium]